MEGSAPRNRSRERHENERVEHAADVVASQRSARSVGDEKRRGPTSGAGDGMHSLELGKGEGCVVLIIFNHRQVDWLVTEVLGRLIRL